MITTYEQAQRAGRHAVRTAILDAATALLVTQGPAALTVRGIAAEVGCSTKVIYTMFGGKDGLVEALWVEGFARFGRALRAAPRGDGPLDHLWELGRTYRAYALAEPDYYRVMFEGVVPGFRPSEAATRESRGTFEILLAAVEECITTGVFAGGDPAEIADTIWMATHGAVSLELAGFYEPDEAERRFTALSKALITAYRKPSR